MTQLQPAVANAIAAWHNMIATKNLSELPAMVRSDAVFRSPMAYQPYASAQAVVLILNTVMGVFENFTYHRELASSDGLNVVLEFSATVGDKQLKGVDLIQFDADGKKVWELTNEEVGGIIKDACGVQRLANGNTIINSYAAGGPNEVKLFEVTPGKQVVWTYAPKDGGHIHNFHVFATDGKVLEGEPLR